METQQTLPLVSIVTPSYNAMPYLKATIESVINQKYPNIEHIIIDGGSNDGTIELLKLYPTLNWISEKDNGQSHALNKGFQKAKGEIIGWLNGDDTYEPEAIITAVKYLLENKDVDLVGSDMNIIDENDKKVGVTFAKTFEINELLNYNMVKQPTVFMHRNVIDKLKGVDEKLHYVMDWEFWLRAGLAGFKIHCLSGVFLANFRLVKGTKSYEDGPKFLEEWHFVLREYLTKPCFVNLSKDVKNKALQNNRSSYQIKMMKKSIDENNKGEMLYHFLKAIKINFNIIKIKGIWKTLIMGFLGKKHDKLRQFNKISS